MFKNVLKLLLLLTLVIIWSGLMVNKVRKDLYGFRACFVDGYETVYCQKQETDSHVIWKVVAQKDDDIVVVQKAYRKSLFQLLEAT